MINKQIEKHDLVFPFWPYECGPWQWLCRRELLALLVGQSEISDLVPLTLALHAIRASHTNVMDIADIHRFFYQQCFQIG